MTSNVCLREKEREDQNSGMPKIFKRERERVKDLDWRQHEELLNDYEKKIKMLLYEVPLLKTSIKEVLRFLHMSMKMIPFDIPIVPFLPHSHSHSEQQHTNKSYKPTTSLPTKLLKMLNNFRFKNKIFLKYWLVWQSGAMVVHWFPVPKSEGSIPSFVASK